MKYPNYKPGLLAMITAYDLEREAYIRGLEDEVADLRKKWNESTSLLMAGDSLRDKIRLDAIMAGAYDNLRKPASGPAEVEVTGNVEKE